MLLSLFILWICSQLEGGAAREAAEGGVRSRVYGTGEERGLGKGPCPPRYFLSVADGRAVPVEISSAFALEHPEQREQLQRASADEPANGSYDTARFVALR